MKFLIIGSGMQGRACAFDMLRNPKTEEVLLADSSGQSLAEAKKFLKSSKVQTMEIDASDVRRVKKLAQDRDAMISCVPYFLNLDLAKAAIAAKTHYVDLGGNTDIVLQELKLHSQAVKAGITLLPDVGLGPSMTTTLAAHAISLLDETKEV